ncbi:MAG: 4-hydroxy-tetrahydrodipicolinate reductase [Maricaulaceae bacterium]
MSKILEVGILGGDGRMGQEIIRALHANPNARLAAALTAPSSPNIDTDAAKLAGLQASGVMLTSDTKAALDACDVMIDFSQPRAAIDTALAMHGTRCQTFVTGTTGYTDVEEAALMAAADTITLLKSGNFSLGVNLLEALTEQAARALGKGWDIEVLEMHHRHKVDAPSGTALMLGKAAAKGRGVDLADVQVPAREGRGDPRAEGEIGFAALRGGGVIGAHELRIASELEMITLSHDAFDRSVFATGAVTAALWAEAQPKGFYTMRDVLGL